MNTITAFGIGAVVFISIVILTAFYLKSASVFVTNTNNDYVIDEPDGSEEDFDDDFDDMD